MKHIFSDQAEVKRRLIDKFIFLFLDYDGTLVPFAGTPSLATPDREILRRLLALNRERVKKGEKVSI